MPWKNADEFRKKHWKAASRGEAVMAKMMAEGMMKSGMDEGMAIATAIKRTKMRGGKA